jgi:hypothetical protein
MLSAAHGSLIRAASRTACVTSAPFSRLVWRERSVVELYPPRMIIKAREKVIAILIASWNCRVGDGLTKLRASLQQKKFSVNIRPC